MKYNLESRLLGEISINSDMQITFTLMAKSEKKKKTREPIDESERGE